ncbi:MAG TPA: sigma-70 family RNA polymerase sigma factor [Bryobacterales bacterium]|nr:sigma-70 family RNA polymerase sigma factor [Bryobacterales bacterium]
MTAALEPDAQLMLRVKDGDSCSFEILLTKYRRPVVNYLYRMVENQAIAEELAQEVFLRVYRARTSYEPTAKFTTWLFRITTHLALNSLRDLKGEKRHQSLDAAAQDGQTPLELADVRRNREQQLVEDARLVSVRAAIAGLPEKQRVAVLMHKYQELDYSQIAGVLGCSVSAVKSLLFRAYETLRERLSHLAEDQKQRSYEAPEGVL